MARKTELILRLLRPFLHGIAIIAIYYAAYRLRFMTDLLSWTNLPLPVIDYNETALFAFLSAALFIVLGSFNGIYQLFRPIPKYYQKLLIVFWLRFLSTTFLSYFWNWFLFISGISRFIILWAWVGVIVVIMLIDGIINSWIQRLSKKNLRNYLVVVRSQEDFDAFMEGWLISEDYNYVIFLWSVENKGEFETILSDGLYDGAVVVGTFTDYSLQEIADKTVILWKQFYHIAESFFLEDLLFRPATLGNQFVMEYKPSPLDWRRRVTKRLFDIVFATLFLIVFSWLYALIALLILIFDRWPIFYRSRRSWQNGHGFRMWKFRTMRVDAEKMKKNLQKDNERQGPLFKMAEDPRVTTLWKVLRKTSLDEIPQFFNILMGTMSVVWPRPHLPEEIERYKSWQKRLLAAKPWITGYAQIFWRDQLSFDQEAKLDLYYMQHRSVFLDVYVIINTLRVLLQGK